ncbi:adenosylcobinamide-phosphate synthase CbiB [Azospira restricta]|uniref:adenosylcobinamide-phosphate synthase CbiB n=1 Tax=Azospira restricta TaxID=404405 RepID=UPI00193B8FE8|nr:adenosylcobinamide-phosphate synthase CbiB [Azospira restricta]
MSLPAPLLLPLFALAGATLDRLLGEPQRWHPLVGFGRIAAGIERRLNRDGGSRPAGLFAWSLAVLPPVLAAGFLCTLPFGWLLHPLLLCFALGGRALEEHGERVAADLEAADLAAAREHVGWMVSRDTSALDEEGVAKAAVESLLENGNDAVFGALFWFFLLGGPGALLFRLANTLDAMWGYRNARFLRFGAAAARLDDALNYLPARLTALSYALFGSFRRALACWRAQAPAWDSPNAGPVMAAGAGALQVALGGPAVYHGRLEVRPRLGEGRAPQAGDIRRALALVRRGLRLWLILALLVGVAAAIFTNGAAHA